MPSDDYEELVERIKRINHINGAESILRWDQEVMMPEGGTPARSRQISVLSSLSHDLFTREDIGKLLDSLENDGLEEEKRAVVREVRRNYTRAMSVPNELIEKISAATSEAVKDWERSKERSDFSLFASHLEKLRDLKIEYASHIDGGKEPYEVLYEDYEPYISLEDTSRILEDVKESIVPLLESIRESGVEIPDVPTGMNEEVQRELTQKLLDILGYDWERARLDVSAHPFTRGDQFDTRITTRFDEENPFESITSTVHEFGHALYNLNLPKEHYGTPLGSGRELIIHESQSRLWENHVGKSRAFWEMFSPHVEELTGKTLSPKDVFMAVNEVNEENLIRVQADELTYHLHIVLRFEMEKELINERIDVDEVPALWNEKSEEYFGLRPENDAEGCLQDIHWSHGSFGYFPTYSMGSVLAAQIFDSLQEGLSGVEEDIRGGNFDPLSRWLEENVHRHGQRFTTQELIKKATGQELNPEFFTDYIERKYSDIYEL